MMNDTLDKEHDADSYYPEKPQLEEGKEKGRIGLISILWFFGLGYWFFDGDLMFILYLVLVIMIHEMGHYIAMRAYHYKDVKMFFVPLLGGMVSGFKEQASQKQKAIISLAGPVPGIFIAIGLYYIAHQNNSDALVNLANIFIFTNLFNLFPIKPLDGGFLIENLFFDRRESIQKLFGILSAGLLIIISLYIQAYMVLIVPVFMIMRLRSADEIKKVRIALDQEKVDYRKTFELLTRKEYSLIRAAIVYKIKAFQSFDVRNYGDPSLEKPLAEHIKMVLLPAPIARLSTTGKLLFLFVWIVTIVAAIVSLAWYFSLHPMEQ